MLAKNNNIHKSVLTQEFVIELGCGMSALAGLQVSYVNYFLFSMSEYQIFTLSRLLCRSNKPSSLQFKEHNAPSQPLSNTSNAAIRQFRHF